jgi:uncharacterized membrane protein YedE/YeeE
MNNKTMNPYLAGFLLGLVLLSTIFVTGRGLGASGASKNVVVAVVGAVAPEHAAASPFYSKLLGPGHENPLKGWLVFEIAGVLLGAFVSGLASDRLKLVTERGPGVAVRSRLAFALAGGALFGVGAQLARGCTSGAALSGMAVLSVAGFLTMVAIFGTGFAFSWATRGLWLQSRDGR